MPNAPLPEILEQIGLSPSEARVYLAALASGATSAAAIAAEAGVKRTTAYSVLESLQARGLINQELRGLKRVFAAASPDLLSTVLESRMKVLDGALPGLMELYNLKGAGGIIKYYEGKAASQTVYEQLLKNARPGDPYLVLSDLDKVIGTYPEFFPDFIERRAKLQLTPRHIFPDTPLARSYGQKLKRLGSATKLLPRSVNFSTNLVVIPRMVVIHQVVPPVYAVVLESPAVVAMMRQIFEIVWMTTPDSPGLV